MKKCILAIILFYSCNTQQKDMSKEAAQEIIAADTAMNNLALQVGFHKALLAYADDSVVKPNEGELPIIGKTNLINYWSGKEETKAISWYPYKAEASSSGDLGYTLGNWKFTLTDTVLYGNYYTIWKKQKDGKWKFVIDGGNNTPQPK